MTVRSAVAELLAKPDLVLSDDLPDDELAWVERMIVGLRKPADDAEAEALVRLISRSDDMLYGLIWPVVHFIESAPSWPIRAVLDACTGAWPERLRQAANNAPALGNPKR